MALDALAQACEIRSEDTGESGKLWGRGFPDARQRRAMRNAQDCVAAVKTAGQQWIATAQPAEIGR
jgi:hypothetical protein